MNNNEKLAKIAVNKSLLKEYSNSSNERIVYMNNGTEFQIQIFNPFSYTIGVTFDFNGGNSTKSKMLVLRPGEHVWLDRYLDNESRLLFSTYEVGSSEEVKKAIRDNSNLCVKFYKEQEKPNYWDNVTYYNYVPTELYCNNSITAANYTNCCSTSLSFGYVPVNSSALTSISTNTPKPRSRSLNKSIETGRIEKGSQSDQKFQNVYKDFSPWSFKTEYIKILPMSQKQINSNDLSKRYCHQCGRKLNQKYKFCPFCGTKQ